MIENYLHPLDLHKQQNHQQFRFKWKLIIIFPVIFIGIIGFPMLNQQLLYPKTNVVPQLPPDIICLDEVYGGASANAGIGGYSQTATLVSASVIWGDSINDFSTEWNFCTGTHWVVPPTFGHIFKHTYKVSGTYHIFVYLTDNLGVSSVLDWIARITIGTSNSTVSSGMSGIYPARA